MDLNSEEDDFANGIEIYDGVLVVGNLWVDSIKSTAVF